jgi:carbonic anhydrase
MSLTQHIKEHNARYAERFDRSKLALPPARHWAIVACMDARLTVEEVTGVGTGDAHIIRNAGGLATDDAIRSLVISTHLLGTNEFAIIEHTGCGMLTFDEEPVRKQIAERTGAATADLRLYPFRDLEANLRDQVRRVATSPLLPKGIPITGFVYEVETGRLRPVASATTGDKAT